jgi:hypothetical protein
MGLFLNIHQERYKVYNQFEIIDEAVEENQSYVDIYSINDFYDNHPRGREKFNITAEQEFWAHCSNIQLWVEHDYDMSLIHSSLGYKLLKSLSNHNIQPVKKRYKNEIVKRFQIGHIESSFFLLAENFHKRFSKEEREQFFLRNNPKLKENIINYLQNYDPELSIKITKRPAIELLGKLKSLRDNDAITILTKYTERIKSRSPLILTLDEFWDIIEKSFQESKGGPWKQEKLMIQFLENHSIDEIFMFRDYFSYFTGLLNKDSLISSLVKEFGVYISDDVWEYRRGHIVALGKEIYEIALYETDNFIKLLKTEVYGDPESIRHEFWAVAYSAFENKTGLPSDHMDSLISQSLLEETEKIYKKLREKHLKIIKERLESKEPKVIADLAYDNFFDYLPKEYLVDVLLDEDLYKIWIEGYFDYGVFSDRYLSRLGESISGLIKEKIIKSIKNNDLDSLLNFFGRGVFDNLTEKDFSDILLNSESNFIEIVLRALEETRKHKYLLEECSIFTHYLKGKSTHLMKKVVNQYVNSFLEGQSKINLETLIKTRFLGILDKTDLLLLFKKDNLNLLEKIIKLSDENYFEIGEWFFNSFLEEKKLSLSTPILKFIVRVLERHDVGFFKLILKLPLLHYLTDNDLISLIRNPNYKFLERILEIIRKTKYVDEFGPLFRDEFLDKNFEFMIKKFKTIVEKGKDDEKIQLIRLGVLTGIDLKAFLEEFNLGSVDFLIDLKTEYFEDVEHWIFDHFKYLNKKGILKQHLIEKIKNNDQKGFIKFIENFMLGYLDEGSIIQIYQDESLDFFGYLFQAIKDTESDFLLYDYFDYNESLILDIKSIMRRNVYKLVLNGDIHKITLIFALQTLTRFFNNDELILFFNNPEIDFFTILAKIVYYNSSSYTDEYLSIDVDLIDCVLREIEEIIKRISIVDPSVLKKYVKMVLSNPIQISLLFIVSYRLLRFLPSNEFVLILEKNDKNVLSSFLEAVSIEENIMGEKIKWLREYIEPELPKLSISLNNKLRTIFNEK